MPYPNNIWEQLEQSREIDREMERRHRGGSDEFKEHSSDKPKEKEKEDV